MFNVVKFELSKEQAEQIKKWRVDENCSWRKIAALCSETYPDLKDTDGQHISRGNQIDGIALCYSAMNFLNEKIEDGWN